MDNLETFRVTMGVENYNDFSSYIIRKKIFQLFLNKVLTFGKQYAIIKAEIEKKGSSKNEKRKNLCDL